MIDYNYIFKEIKIALRNLPGNACKIYLELGFHRDPYSYVTNIMTYAQLAEFSGVSKSHVREHIQLLQKEGIIEIIKITGKKHGSYQFYLKLDERTSTLNSKLHFKRKKSHHKTAINHPYKKCQMILKHPKPT